MPYPNYQDEQPQLTIPIAYSDPIGRIIPSALNLDLEDNGQFYQHVWLEWVLVMLDNPSPIKPQTAHP